MSQDLRISIIPCTYERAGEAEALARSVFKWDLIPIRISFLIFKYPHNIFVRWLSRLAGIRDYLSTDIYVDENDKVLGTIGLYRTWKDAQEAVWVSWFCVAPQARKLGIGQALIDHVVSQARAGGYPIIRLYTSTDPIEAAAQYIYEKNGFVETSRKKTPFTTIIYREKRLDG